MSARPLIALTLAATILPGLAWAAAVCPERKAPAGVARIAEVMATGRFVAYQPTGIQIFDGKATEADEASLMADLKVLRPRFDGLITYGALHGAERVPDVAAKLGYRAVIMGIWDPKDDTERANVIAAAGRQPGLVAGVSVGNELVLAKRGSFVASAKALRDLHVQAPQLAITTTEPFHTWLEAGAAPVLREADLLLANAHPIFETWFRAAPDFNAADFVVQITDKMAEVYCGPILVKETGVPTAPKKLGYTAKRQASFYAALQAQFPPTPKRAFAYFSAFDAPWRVYDAQAVPGNHPEEAHWGFYDKDRNPKAVVEAIALLKAKP